MALDTVFLPLSLALQDWQPDCREAALAWFRACLSDLEPTQALLVRSCPDTAGRPGQLLRFEAEPTSLRGPRLQVTGHYADFMTQLAPLRRALGFLDYPHLGTWLLDAATGLLDVDPSWAAILGYTLEDLGTFSHDDWEAMTHPDDVKGFGAPEIHAALNRGEVIQHVTRTRHREGHWVWMLTCCRGALWDDQGRMLRMIGYDIDITEHRTLLAQNEDQRQVMQRILDVMPSGQLVLDSAGRITFLNPEAADLIDVASVHAIGQEMLALLPLEEGREAIRAALEGSHPVRDLPIILRASPGNGLDASVRAHLGGQARADVDGRRHLTAHFTKAPGIGQTFVSLTDVTAQVASRRALEQAVDQARFLATHDLMTGLPDRYDFLHRLSQTLVAAGPERRPVAVMMLDLDNFKLINDGMGHDKGDQLIKAAAERLKRALPDSARLARFGGDEFVIMVPDCPPTEAALLAEDLRNRFAEPLPFSLRHSLISCSIGMGLFPQDAQTAADLMRCADLAMYEAKALGRGQIRRYSPDLRLKNERRNAVVHAVQRALSEGGFHIVLQPKFDLGNLKAPMGAEVLLRLNDPDLGAVSPAEFIPIAEAQGLIPAIDRLVVRLVRELRPRLDSLALSINLSALTLSAPSFGDLLDELPLAAGQGGLIVEVTETSFMGRLTAVRDTLHLLRGFGIGVAVDDFGIGHSSLAYLQSLPVQELKIDRSFVSGLGREEGPSQGIVRAILAMAEALGLATVAEGVETTEQADWLIDHGCQMAQGFLLGRPVDPQEFLRIFPLPDPRGPGAGEAPYGAQSPATKGRGPSGSGAKGTKDQGALR